MTHTKHDPFYGPTTHCYIPPVYLFRLEMHHFVKKRVNCMSAYTFCCILYNKHKCYVIALFFFQNMYTQKFSSLFEMDTYICIIRQWQRDIKRHQNR